MIAPETNHSLRIAVDALQNIRNAPWCIGTAVNQITEKNQHVNVFVSRDHIHQISELGATTVDITDDEGFHAEYASPFSCLLLIPAISSKKRGSL